MDNQKESVSHLQTVTKEQMLERIYEVIASERIASVCTYCEDETTREHYHEDMTWSIIEVKKKNPVMIGDIFERLRGDKRDELCKMCDDIYNLYIGVMKMWKDKRKPINEQSEDCIRLIYSFAN